MQTDTSATLKTVSTVDLDAASRNGGTDGAHRESLITCMVYMSAEDSMSASPLVIAVALLVAVGVILDKSTFITTIPVKAMIHAVQVLLFTAQNSPTNKADMRGTKIVVTAYKHLLRVSFLHSRFCR